MTNLQKKCSMALIILLLVLGFTTYFANQIYNTLLPTVMTTKPVPLEIGEDIIVKASIDYADPEDAKKGFYLSFSSPESQEIPLTAIGTVSLPIIVEKDGNTKITTDEIKVLIDTRKYIAENESFIYRSKLVKFTPELEEGRHIDLPLAYNYKKYDNVIPLSAVNVITDKTGYVFLLSQNEKKLVVQRLQVNIMSKNDRYAALSYVDGDVVTYFDKPITDGIPVKMLQSIY